MQAKMLKLILQPIVENSFLHGIKGKIDTAEITITGFLQDATLEIEIKDNGEGIPANKLLEINKSLESIESRPMCRSATSG